MMSQPSSCLGQQFVHFSNGFFTGSNKGGRWITSTFFGNDSCASLSIYLNRILGCIDWGHVDSLGFFGDFIFVKAARFLGTLIDVLCCLVT